MTVLDGFIFLLQRGIEKGYEKAPVEAEYGAITGLVKTLYVIELKAILHSGYNLSEWLKSMEKWAFQRLPDNLFT